MDEMPLGIICNCALQIFGSILSNSEIRQNVFLFLMNENAVGV